MKVLLHICCAVCASSVVERLLIEGHKVTGFFYNPNIHPTDEYEKRLNATNKVANETGIELVVIPYDRENWFPAVRGLEYEPEGGARCDMCFEMRLQKTYDYCLKHMYDLFMTTLTVSPHKDALKVNEIGIRIGGDRFFPADFKKKDGFARAMELAVEMGIYKQDYCGCLYSLEEKFRKEKKKGAGLGKKTKIAGKSDDKKHIY